VNFLDTSHVTAAVRRPFATVVVAVTAVALLAGCGGGGGATASTPASTPAPASSPVSGSAITISNFKFSPATLTVRPGARIDVTNEDSAPHTVTADDGQSFDSGTLQQGGSKTITAPRTGRYPFHCTVHPFMKGQLVVGSGA
jgi:plastocyanin